MNMPVNKVSYLNLKEFVGGKKLVLFGASKTAAEALNMIDDTIDVAYICDNDKQKQGKRYRGLEIKPTEALLGEDNDRLAVLVSRYLKMSNQKSFCPMSST
jgi:hypothetical protein